MSSGKLKLLLSILLIAALSLVVMPTSSLTSAQDDSSISIFTNDRPETHFIAHGAISGTENAMFNIMHCKMLTLDDEYNLQPQLADSYEVSDDELTYTFHLNPDAKWHDGTPVTTADVEFSWVAYATTEAQTGARIRPPVITSIVGGEAVQASAAEAEGYADTLKYEGIEVVDDQTINFTLNSPDPLWIITTHQYPNGWMLPKHVLGDVPYAEWRDQPIFLEAPLGCGSYQFAERIEGQYVKFEAFEDYHLGAPNIKEVFFANWLTEDVGIAQLQTGELDLMLGIAPSDAEFLLDESDIEIISTPAAAAYQLSINTFRVEDPLVRRAMVHAIDRQGILDAVFLGQGKVQECCFLNEWAIPEGQELYEYNPDLARDLLAQAGWDSSQELSIIYPLDYRQSDTIVPIVQQQLAEVGIQTVIDPQESTAFRQKLIEERDWDIFFTQGANMLPDPGSFTVWECASGGSPMSGWVYCDDHFAELYTIGRTTVDFAARQAAYQEIQTIFYEELPTIYLFLPFSSFAVQPGLEGLTPTANRADITWNMKDWTLNR